MTKLIPFDEPAPKIDYEYCSPQTAAEVTQKLMRNFYEEIEGVICCCMAAGVSADKIVMTEPKIISDGFNVQMGCYISFEGLNK